MDIHTTSQTLILLVRSRCSFCVFSPTSHFKYKQCALFRPKTLLRVVSFLRFFVVCVNINENLAHFLPYFDWSLHSSVLSNSNTTVVLPG